jgi:hypothetical protein
MFMENAVETGRHIASAILVEEGVAHRRWSIDGNAKGRHSVRMA